MIDLLRRNALPAGTNEGKILGLLHNWYGLFGNEGKPCACVGTGSVLDWTPIPFDSEFKSELNMLSLCVHTVDELLWPNPHHLTEHEQRAPTNPPTYNGTTSQSSSRTAVRRPGLADVDLYLP